MTQPGPDGLPSSFGFSVFVGSFLRTIPSPGADRAHSSSSREIVHRVPEIHRLSC